MHNPVVEGEVKMPDMETAEVTDMLRSFNLAENLVVPVVNSIRADERPWVDFMMRFEPGLEEPDPKRARNRTLTMPCCVVFRGTSILASAARRLVSGLCLAPVASFTVSVCASSMTESKTSTVLGGFFQ